MGAHEARHIERIAANAARFRRVNEGIAHEALGHDTPPDRQHNFICECVMSECTDEVMLAADEYNHVRSVATWFVVCPEHVMPMGDRIVEQTPRYWIVEKVDAGRRVAETESTTPEPDDTPEKLAGGGLARAVQAARWQESEYEHALDHYVQLMRHRLANPLTAISGLARTLVEIPDLDDATRTEMLRTIDEQAQKLLQISLDPRRVGDEEHELSAEPFRQGRWFFGR